MNQPDLFSSPPVNGSGVTLIASRSGAQAISHCWTARQSGYLQLLRNAGALNDKEAAKLLGCDVSSICSVRNAVKHLITTDGHDAFTFIDQSGRERTTKRTRFRLK